MFFCFDKQARFFTGPTVFRAFEFEYSFACLIQGKGSSRAHYDLFVQAMHVSCEAYTRQLAGMLIR